MIRHHLCWLLTLLVAGLAAAAAPGDLAGARALLVQPENSYNGYDFSIQAALLRRGWEVVPGEPALLTDAAQLAGYDLVVTNLKRSFTPDQVAGLRTYLAAGGAVYGNWGGPMGCPELLRAAGLAHARSVYLKELTLPVSPLTADGPQRWPFPAFAGHAKLADQGHEMVAFDRLDGLEVARDSEGRCLGALRQEGAGRCAVLGFCPSNYRFVTADREQAEALLDRLLAWLLPQGSRPHPPATTVRVALPRGSRVTTVTVDGRRLAAPAPATLGSLLTVTVPVDQWAVGQTARIEVAATLPATARHVETWIHDPVASSFLAFEPAAAASFLAELGASVVQPLLRYEGGSVCYLQPLAGDRPRERFAKYPGDLLAEYVSACHARGIRVIGGLYLDWRRFETVLADAPPYVAQGQPAPERKLRQPVCPLDSGVWQHNVAVVENLLDHYPALDGVILDDNFEFDGRPCYCPACLAKFEAYARQQGIGPAEPGGEAWRAFWLGQKREFCRRIHEVCAARGKPVGGWTGQRGPLGLRGAFDFAGDMVYVEPPSSVAPLWPLVGDFPVVTLLWGMNRRPDDLPRDLVEAVRAGSSAVGYWLAYTRVDGATDNPWSLGSRPGDHFALTPGSLTAVQRAFAGAEQVWRDYYRDHLLLGDARFQVTAAKLDAQGLTLTVQRRERPAAQRIAGPVALPGLDPTPPASAAGGPR